MAMRSQKWLCDCVGGAKSLGSGAEPGTDARYKSDSRAGELATAGHYRSRFEIRERVKQIRRQWLGIPHRPRHRPVAPAATGDGRGSFAVAT